PWLIPPFAPEEQPLAPKAGFIIFKVAGEVADVPPFLKRVAGGERDPLRREDGGRPAEARLEGNGWNRTRFVEIGPRTSRSGLESPPCLERLLISPGERCRPGAEKEPHAHYGERFPEIEADVRTEAVEVIARVLEARSIGGCRVSKDGGEARAQPPLDF